MTINRAMQTIPDPFQPGRQATRYESAAGNYFRILGSQRIGPGKRMDMWELRISDVRGGLNVLDGDLENSHDRTRSSSLDTRQLRHLILPSLVTAAATPDISANPPRLCHANIFDTLMLGGGSTTDSGVFSETSATNPAIAAVTYTPTSAITCMVPVNWGSATVAKMLLVGRLSNAAQLISAADGTVNATCHADVNPLWGAIQTILPENPILLYMNGTISSVDGTSAATTQPTAGPANPTNGGYEVGLLALGQGELRAYWVWPHQNTAAGMLVDNAIKYGRVVSTNMEGGDPRELEIETRALRGIVNCMHVPARGALVMGDRINTVIHTGTQIIDTKQFENRVPDSDRVFRCHGYWRNGPELFAKVQYRANPFSSATPATQFWIEQYSWNTGAWHQVSAATTLSTNGDLGALSGNGFPLSAETGFLHWYGDGSWHRQFQPPASQNLFNYRETSGAAAASGQAFASSGTWTGPHWEFPGYVGCPKITTEIIFGGRIESLGTPTTDASVAWSDGQVTATFGVDNNNLRQIWPFPGNKSPFFKFQPTCTATQQAGGTDPTRLNVNCFPVIFRGVVFVDEPEMPEWIDDPRGR